MTVFLRGMFFLKGLGNMGTWTAAYEAGKRKNLEKGGGGNTFVFPSAFFCLFCFLSLLFLLFGVMAGKERVRVKGVRVIPGS